MVSSGLVVLLILFVASHLHPRVRGAEVGGTLLAPCGVEIPSNTTIIIPWDCEGNTLLLRPPTETVWENVAVSIEGNEQKRTNVSIGLAGSSLSITRNITIHVINVTLYNSVDMTKPPPAASPTLGIGFHFVGSNITDVTIRFSGCNLTGDALDGSLVSFTAAKLHNIHVLVMRSVMNVRALTSHGHGAFSFHADTNNTFHSNVSILVVSSMVRWTVRCASVADECSETSVIVFRTSDSLTTVSDLSARIAHSTVETSIDVYPGFSGSESLDCGDTTIVRFRGTPKGVGVRFLRPVVLLDASTFALQANGSVAIILVERFGIKSEDLVNLPPVAFGSLSGMFNATITATSLVVRLRTSGTFSSRRSARNSNFMLVTTESLLSTAHLQFTTLTIDVNSMAGLPGHQVLANRTTAMTYVGADAIVLGNCLDVAITVQRLVQHVQFYNGTAPCARANDSTSAFNLPFCTTSFSVGSTILQLPSRLVIRDVTVNLFGSSLSQVLDGLDVEPTKPYLFFPISGVSLSYCSLVVLTSSAVRLNVNASNMTLSCESHRIASLANPADVGGGGGATTYTRYDAPLIVVPLSALVATALVDRIVEVITLPIVAQLTNQTPDELEKSISGLISACHIHMDDAAISFTDLRMVVDLSNLRTNFSALQFGQHITLVYAPPQMIHSTLFLANVSIQVIEPTAITAAVALSTTTLLSVSSANTSLVSSTAIFLNVRDATTLLVINGGSHLSFVGGDSSVLVATTAFTPKTDGSGMFHIASTFGSPNDRQQLTIAWILLEDNAGGQQGLVLSQCTIGSNVTSFGPNGGTPQVRVDAGGLRLECNSWGGEPFPSKVFDAARAYRGLGVTGRKAFIYDAASTTTGGGGGAFTGCGPLVSSWTTPMTASILPDAEALQTEPLLSSPSIVLAVITLINPFDSVALVALGLGSCAPPEAKSSFAAAQVLMSPFYAFEDALVAVLGNIGLCVFFVVVHYGSVVVLRRHKRRQMDRTMVLRTFARREGSEFHRGDVTYGMSATPSRPAKGAIAKNSPRVGASSLQGKRHPGRSSGAPVAQQPSAAPPLEAHPRSAAAALRFPNHSIAACSLSMSGTAFYCGQLLTAAIHVDPRRAGNIVGLVGATIVIVSGVAAPWWWLMTRARSIRRLRFVWRADNRRALRTKQWGPRWVNRWLLPLGCWEPQELRLQFGRLRNFAVENQTRFALLPSALSAFTSLLLGIGVDRTWWCPLQATLLTLIHVGGISVLAVTRPARVPLIGALIGLFWAFQIPLFICSALVNANIGHTESLGTVVTVFSVMASLVSASKMATAVYVMWWERRMRDQTNLPQRDSRGLATPRLQKVVGETRRRDRTDVPPTKTSSRRPTCMVPTEHLRSLLRHCRKYGRGAGGNADVRLEILVWLCTNCDPAHPLTPEAAGIVGVRAARVL